MAYGDPGQRISDLMIAAKQAKEQQFFSNLLQYGMTAGGDFDIVDGDPVYSGGAPMPDKTALWNQYVNMKNGRISPADIQAFEAQYTQASSMRTQRQMAELNKLSMRGVSDKKIRKSIKDSPGLYNNLLDLVSDLEASGDEQAFAQAQMVRGYLPDTDKSVLEGLAEEPGLLGRVGGPLAVAGGYAATQYLRATPQESIDAAKEARKDKAAISKEIKEQKGKLKDVGRKPSLIKADLKVANQNLNAESNKNVLQRNDQKMKDLRKKVADLKAEQSKAGKTTKGNVQIQKKIDALEANKKGIKVVKPEPRYKTLMKRIPKGGGAANILGYGLAGSGGAVGEYLGGETGRKYGRTAGNLIQLALSAKAGYAAPLFAAAPLADLYEQYQGR